MDKLLIQNDDAQLTNALDEILLSCPSPYDLLKIQSKTSPSKQHDPIHYFSHSPMQSPHTKALQLVSEAAYAMLSQPDMKELYDLYLTAESRIYQSVKEAANKESEIETTTWFETWKQAYKGNTIQVQANFERTQTEIGQVIKLYENVIQLGKDLHSYTDKLNPFFTRHYQYSLDKITKTIEFIKICNTRLNPVPLNLKVSVERNSPTHACTSWDAFTILLSNHINDLKKIQNERLHKKVVLDEICAVAISRDLELSGGLAANLNGVDASLQEINKRLLEYIMLLGKAQRSTANSDKLAAINILIQNLGDISNTIYDPTKYTADKILKAQEINLHFSQSQQSSGLKKLEKGFFGHLKAILKDSISIKDILAQYNKDSDFHEVLAKFNMHKQLKP